MRDELNMATHYIDVSGQVRQRAVISLAAWRALATDCHHGPSRARQVLGLFRLAGQLESFGGRVLVLDSGARVVIEKQPALTDEGEVLVARLDSDERLKPSAAA